MALSLPSTPVPVDAETSPDRWTAASGGPLGEPSQVVVPSMGAPATTGPAQPAVRSPLRSLASSAPTVHRRRICVQVANVRSGPGVSHRVVTTLRRGAVVRGTSTRGWLRLGSSRWVSVSVTCAVGVGAAGTKARPGGDAAFRAWVRAIDPAGNARWTMDRAHTHARGVIRGLTVFRSSGPTRSTVYIQPGMTWSKTKLVMAHEAIHVRQIRYGGFAHSLRAFGSIRGMERAADCGATIILGTVVRAGCPAGMATSVRHLLAGRPA